MLRGYLALYMVDVVGATGAQAALAVVVWTCLCLAGEFLLLQVLERVGGLRYLRWSTSCVVVLFPLFLLAEGFGAKVALLGALGFVNAGWYSILKAQLYAELPGRSGTVMALDNVAGTVASLAPLALGAFAQRYGLGAMMWLLLSGPLAAARGAADRARQARVSPLHARARSASSSTAAISSSVCRLKFAYQRPTWPNGSGVARQIDSSATAATDARPSTEATGKAATTRAGSRVRSARSTARRVEPVRTPLSMRMTVRRERSSGVRAPRHARTRASNSRSASARKLSSAGSLVVARGAAGREFFVEDERARHAHGADRLLRPARHEQAADEHDIERRAQSLRHLRRDRHAAARDREHDRPLKVCRGPRPSSQARGPRCRGL